MKRISGGDRPLLRQFKRWARALSRVSPIYVRDPERLKDYVRGPNWDNPDCGYAHYRETVAAYGEELLGLFERMREDGRTEEYRGLLAEVGIEEVK